MSKNIYISGLQNYSCMMCGLCCRRFLVLLTPEERARIASRDWSEFEDVPAEFSERINGWLYFKRGPRGCVFVGENGACRMHAKCGFDFKAFTCRGYPFNIVSTFPGEISVLARMDCPAVLANHGKPIREQRRDIEKLVSEMKFGSGFTDVQLCGLERGAVEKIRDFARRIIDCSSSDFPRRMRMLMLFSRRCAQLGATFLNDDSTMNQVYETLLGKLESEAAELPRWRISAPLRWIFIQRLVAYARRDEETIKVTPMYRMRQCWNIARLVLGGGNLRSISMEHPDMPLSKVKLLSCEKIRFGEGAFDSFIRFAHVRLECLQFFGVAYYGVDIFAGIRALCLAFTVVLAFARIHAAERGSDCIEAEDMDYGVFAMDHCHGRQPFLRFKTARIRENRLADSFSQLLYSLGC